MSWASVAFELGLRLLNVHVGVHSLGKQVFGELEDFSKAGDRRAEQLFLRIKLTQLEVVLRQAAWKLRRAFSRLAGSPEHWPDSPPQCGDLTPDVDFPRYVERPGNNSRRYSWRG